MKPREWFFTAGVIVGLVYLGHSLVHSPAALAGSVPFVLLAGGYRGLLYLRKR